MEIILIIIIIIAAPFMLFGVAWIVARALMKQLPDLPPKELPDKDDNPHMWIG